MAASNALRPVTTDARPAPEGARVVIDPTDRHVDEAAALVASEYWNEGVARARLVRAMRASTVMAVAVDAEDRVIATARALSDGARSAWMGDVCVAKSWRGRGLGKAVVAAVLEHPLVCDTDRVRLNTRDAQSLYASFGFVETASEVRPFPSSEMVLRRR